MEDIERIISAKNRVFHGGLGLGKDNPISLHIDTGHIYRVTGSSQIEDICRYKKWRYIMSEALSNLNDGYKQKKKEAISKEENQKIKQDYKEMKALIKGADKLLQKHDQKLKKIDKEWDKLIPELEQNFNSIGKEKIKYEDNEEVKGMSKELDNNYQKFDEQRKHSDEVIRKSYETIKQIDEKLEQLEKEKNIIDNKEIKITVKEYIPTVPNDDIKLSIELYSKHFLEFVKPHTIFYKNEQINDEIKYKKIVELIDNNIDNIKRLNMEKISSYKGGLQEIITIQIDNDNFILVGNTDNQEMKQLYNDIKDKILIIIEQKR